MADLYLSVEMKGHKSKPDAIEVTRNLKCANPSFLSWQELAGAIEQGKSFLNGRLIERGAGRPLSGSNMDSFSLIGIDVDEGSKYPSSYVIDEIYSKLGVRPKLAYETFSSTSEHRKYRLLYELKCKVDYKEYGQILTSICQLFEFQDKACKNPNRIWYATNKKVYFINNPIPFTSETVAKLKALTPAPAPSFATSIKRDSKQAKPLNNIEVDMVEYLESLGYELEQVGSNYYMPCPLHNGTGSRSFCVHFDGEKWLFKCFSKCGEGGDILTLVMKLHNLSYQQAEHHLKQYKIDKKKAISRVGRRVIFGRKSNFTY